MRVNAVQNTGKFQNYGIEVVVFNRISSTFGDDGATIAGALRTFQAPQALMPRWVDISRGPTKGRYPCAPTCYARTTLDRGLRR